MAKQKDRGFEEARRSLSNYLARFESAKLRICLPDTGNADMDNHRLASYTDIDMMLEAGKITSKQAQQMKRDWDARHGY